MSTLPHQGSIASVFLVLGFAAIGTPAFAAMSAPEQNALVKKYCAVCHTDAARNGGLSLQHYDAARRDPTLAAMMLSKLDNGAMGAAGVGVPDKAAQAAWLASTREQAAGADKWFVSDEGGAVSASIVLNAPARTGVTGLPAYRFRMACTAASGLGEMQLTWAPAPQTGQTMTVSVDGAVPVAYRIEGKESMGNGGSVQTGHASLMLSEGAKLPMARRSLTIQNLFPGETVAVPFSDLDKKTSTELQKCF